MKTSIVTTRQLELFRQTVLRFFEHEGRDLPWRQTTDPYAIYLSEVMLQQTQVDRVAQKFPVFLATFPTPQALAEAPLATVLEAWQGFGYNRRGLHLKRAAEQMVERHGAALPKTVEELDDLPGIGYATASAIAAYAFNLPTVFIETNIRAVFIHHFFSDAEKVSDAQLLPLVEAALDRTNPRRWYSALMDYGTHLKKLHGNPARRSRHHVKQSRFEGSEREIRSMILKLLLAHKKLGRKELHSLIDRESARIERNLAGLIAEGFVIKNGEELYVPGSS
ncbi:endonuclease III [Candidatus Peregrinibacteria bacterium CG_4_9_14_0_2_um_filter_53_11]|nr:MAG: endonuclease III [Candidatus Peregrinibacteria bacterium CG_4_9_14_0_2_um_filter_53_11]